MPFGTEAGMHGRKAISGEHPCLVAGARQGKGSPWAGSSPNSLDYRAAWTFVHAEKLSFKKTVVASERDRPDVAQRRGAVAQDRVEPERLVFFDETAVRTNMMPLRWTAHGLRLEARPRTGIGRPRPSWLR
jgi:hypothetical protein